jgi:hypothetical protein
MSLEMLGIHDFWPFVASGLPLNITPRSDTAGIASRGPALQARSIL